MTTAQIEFTEAELLSTHAVTEPLFAGGVRCHGGFDAAGDYISPRTEFRAPAIVAWQDHHKQVFGKDRIEVPLETWPAHYPNVAQARHLIEADVPQPLISTLTRIGKVEGFGANIRNLRPTNVQRWFDEDVKGSAIDHLGRGLFEAHGRDEAGFEEEAGHEQMWYAARDVAFGDRTTEIDMDALMDRLGFSPTAAAKRAAAPRLLPDDIEPELEMVAGLMVRVLMIEVSAFHTFAWADAWLSDHNLVAGDGKAAELVACIRADETPHVGYLATALTEMRDRTWVGTAGAKHAGADMFQLIWDRALNASTGDAAVANRAAAAQEVAFWCAKAAKGDDILARFHGLADVEALQPA